MKIGQLFATGKTNLSLCRAWCRVWGGGLTVEEIAENEQKASRNFLALWFSLAMLVWIMFCAWGIPNASEIEKMGDIAQMKLHRLNFIGGILLLVAALGFLWAFVSVVMPEASSHRQFIEDSVIFFRLIDQSDELQEFQNKFDIDWFHEMAHHCLAEAAADMLFTQKINRMSDDYKAADAEMRRRFILCKAFGFCDDEEGYGPHFNRGEGVMKESGWKSSYDKTETEDSDGESN